MEVDVEATYFFGGAVGDAPVNWSVTASDYSFDRYQGPGYYGWNDIDYSGVNDTARGGLIASGEGQTDAQGKFKITLPAKLDEKTGSQIFNIEAAVTDLNDQHVANRVSVIVHQGQYYIGIAPVDYVGTAGKPMDFNLLTVDWQGEPVGQQESRRRVLSARMVQRAGERRLRQHHVDVVVQRYGGVHGDGRPPARTAKARRRSRRPPGGEYRVVARGTDDKGNKISSSTYVWVSSQEYVSWRQDNNDRIALVADKKEYTPGDVAKILIPSPYQGQVRALVTTERGRILDAKVIDSQDQQRRDRSADHAGHGAQCVRVGRHRQGRRSKRSRAVVQDRAMPRSRSIARSKS